MRPMLRSTPGGAVEDSARALVVSFSASLLEAVASSGAAPTLRAVVAIAPRDRCAWSQSAASVTGNVLGHTRVPVNVFRRILEKVAPFIFVSGAASPTANLSVLPLHASFGTTPNTTNPTFRVDVRHSHAAPRAGTPRRPTARYAGSWDGGKTCQPAEFRPPCLHTPGDRLPRIRRARPDEPHRGQIRKRCRRSRMSSWRSQCSSRS